MESALSQQVFTRLQEIDTAFVHVSTKIYDKRDDFDIEIVSFPFLDGDVPCFTSYEVYISQLI